MPRRQAPLRVHLRREMATGFETRQGVKTQQGKAVGVGIFLTNVSISINKMPLRIKLL